MTTPDDREKAKTEATQALVHAEQIRDRSVSMGERWRQSQRDNNFRQMLRAIGRGVSSA